MGVEVLKSDMMPASKEENSGLHGEENGKAVLGEPIKFGSNGTDEPVKQELNNFSEVNFPSDAVDEWPEHKEIHSFYVVKYRSYDDQKLKAKLDQADKELQRKNQNRYQITEKLRAKRADRAQVIAQLKSLSVDNRQFRTIMDEKRKEMEPLQQALGKLRGGSSMAREKRVSICSSEDELNDLIKSLQYRIQHESIPLAEEKQLLREIKQFEGTREKVIANAAERLKIQDSFGEKEAIQDQVKLIGGDLDEVRKEQQVVRTKLKLLEDEKEAIDKQINALQEELTTVTENRDKTFENIQGLRKQRDEGNAGFYQNRMLLTKARELAARKDVEGLRNLSDVEVDKFIAQWNSKKAFRDDYERRILSSLDIRQFSRDGRMRNPDEKALVETPAPMEAYLVAKNVAKLPKKDHTPPQNDILFSQKVHKEKNSKQQRQEGNKATKETLEQREDKEEIYGLEKKQEKVNQIDEAKLKDLKREELAKAKLALERKKKLADKAAAKAAVKAQKEAEKKLREREKKAKKKATAVVTDVMEPTEAVAEATEPERTDENVDEASVPPKNKETTKGKAWKENPIRYRSRAKGPEALPKAMLKRKKTTNYWVWAASAAAILLLILVLAFYYFQTSSRRYDT